jgi:hypothetical protein
VESSTAATWEEEIGSRTPSGIAALNHEITRRAAMIAYKADFAPMVIAVLASLSLLLLAPQSSPTAGARGSND